jgi:hypothetical protein
MAILVICTHFSGSSPLIFYAVRVWRGKGVG